MLVNLQIIHFHLHSAGSSLLSLARKIFWPTLNLATRLQSWHSCPNSQESARAYQFSLHKNVIFIVTVQLTCATLASSSSHWSSNMSAAGGCPLPPPVATWDLWLVKKNSCQNSCLLNRSIANPTWMNPSEFVHFHHWIKYKISNHQNGFWFKKV